MRKTLAVGRKEFRQIARDRRSLMVLLFVPAFFLLLYGYALSFDVQNIQLAVLDNDRSRASRELVNAFVKSGYFQLAADVSSARGHSGTRRGPTAGQHFDHPQCLHVRQLPSCATVEPHSGQVTRALAPPLLAGDPPPASAARAAVRGKVPLPSLRCR